VEDSSGRHRRILISFRYMSILFPLCILLHPEPWYCNKCFLRLCCMKWTKYCKPALIIDPGYKMWIVRVLLLGVLDGIARFSSLSGYLVSSERQMPPKAC
jgi:hypothetical protein